jgi:hypothetical protein
MLKCVCQSRKRVAFASPETDGLFDIVENDNMTLATDASADKLATIRERRKRWQARLTRATNTLAKLARAEARLLKPAKPIITVKQAVTVPATIAPAVADDLAVPPFLQRSQADADKMKAERKAKEEAARKAMPLTGREALKAIRRKKLKSKPPSAMGAAFYWPCLTALYIDRLRLHYGDGLTRRR